MRCEHMQKLKCSYLLAPLLLPHTAKADPDMHAYNTVNCSARQDSYIARQARSRKYTTSRVHTLTCRYTLQLRQVRKLPLAAGSCQGDSIGQKHMASTLALRLLLGAGQSPQYPRRLCRSSLLSMPHAARLLQLCKRSVAQGVIYCKLCRCQKIVKQLQPAVPLQYSAL